jgi:hypothetical protein
VSWHLSHAAPYSVVVVVIADKCDSIKLSHYRTSAQAVALGYDGSMRETEKIGPPWELEVTSEDGRIMEVTIRSTNGYGLFPATVREAMNEVYKRMRAPVPTAGKSSEQEPADAVLTLLGATYAASHGRMTEQYLAMLALAYSHVSLTRSGAIIPVLAEAIEGNPATVKRHVMKARAEGFLTPTAPGKEGGHPTARALEIAEATIDSGMEALALSADEMAEPGTATVDVEMPLRAVEDKPKRRRTQKAITPRTHI